MACHACGAPVQLLRLQGHAGAGRGGLLLSTAGRTVPGQLSSGAAPPLPGPGPAAPQSAGCAAGRAAAAASTSSASSAS